MRHSRSVLIDSLWSSCPQIQNSLKTIEIYEWKSDCQWVGMGWREASHLLKDTVIRSFAKCGIALPISGSSDREINTGVLPNYHINESADAEEIKFSLIQTLSRKASQIR